MKLYRVLLRLLPRPFRERFEAEMLELFEQRSGEAGTTVGARVTFWRTVLADLVRSIFRERFNPTLQDLPLESGSRGGVSMGAFGSDLRQAWRMVARAPWLTAFAAVLMALSIGTTTAAFSVVNSVLLRPFPFARPDRLVIVWERQSVENQRNTVGAHEFPEWKRRSGSFSQLAALTFDREYNLTGAGDPMKLAAVRVTSDFFAVMGVPAEAGRTFDADEDQPGRGQVVVISDRLWRSRFGADPTLVGRPIHMNGTPYTVVGVMPATFEFPSGARGAPPDIWVPIAEPIHLYRGRHYLWVVGRLKDGVTVAQAQSEMDAIAAAIAREMPQFSRGHGVNIQPLHAEIVQSARRALLLVFGGVTLVLFIGCCNVANLLLARAASRQQEMALRMALGAGRLRIARQLLMEGSLLGVAGGTGGLLAASWLTSAVRAAAPADVPRLHTAHLDPTGLFFAAGLSVLSAVVFGLVPFAQVARIQIAERLKHGSKGIARPARQPLRTTLVLIEVTLTMIVATGAALMLQSFARLLNVDPGFQTRGILTLDIALPPARFASPASQCGFIDEAIARVAALPGVSGVAAASLVPQGGGRSGIAVAIEGRRAMAPGESASAGFRVVSDGYFATLGIPLAAGRDFNAGDARAAVPLIRWFPQQPLPPHFTDPQPAPVAVVNQSMARRFWPGENPIGRRFTVLFSPPITVIGVVVDHRDASLWDEPEAEFYLSSRQEPQGRITLLARSAAPLQTLPPMLRAAIWSIDRELPAADIHALSDLVDANVSLYRGMVVLMTAFGAAALLLMALGVYAVVSYTTAQRTYEIGVRLALGAQRADIGRLVLVNGLGVAAAGVLAGVGGAYALARYAAALLYEVRPADPATYASLAVLVLVVAAFATWAPARRAQRVDPVAVLRNE